MKHFKEITNRISQYESQLLAIWVWIVCMIPNVALSITEPMSVSGRLANVVLPAGIYMLLLSVTRKVGKCGCWMFVLMFFAAFQIVLLYLFGRSVIAVDMFLNVVTTNPEEVGELLGNMLPIIVVVAALYLPTLLISIYATVKKWLLSDRFIKRMRIAGAATTLLGIAIAGYCMLSSKGYSPITDIYPANVAENICIAVDRYVRTSRYHESSAAFSYESKSTRDADKKEVYVAVIGETSRAPQWSLFGYDRPTTEAIDTLSGLVAYRYAVSESNTTHKSVPMLLSGLDARRFGEEIYSHKSLITAFKEAGYHTTYISNQAPNHSFIDFFGNEADTTIFLNDPLGSAAMHKFDNDALDVLQKATAHNSRTKQLYVLHLYGSHFCYTDRYPAGTGSYKPDSPVDVSGSNNTRLINAYDNTIEYNARLLLRLSEILNSLGCEAAFVYTSDHGEDIFDDDRKMFLHASPVPSYYQIHVPMLLWGTERYRSEYPALYAAAMANREGQVSTSASYFHTLMEMAGITNRQFNYELSLVNKGFTPYRRLYLNDHNKAIPLSLSGIEDEDMTAFNKAGISNF